MREILKKGEQIMRNLFSIELAEEPSFDLFKNILSLNQTQIRGFILNPQNNNFQVHYSIGSGKPQVMNLRVRVSDSDSDFKLQSELMKANVLASRSRIGGYFSFFLEGAILYLYVS